jgi:hypothetical protein
MRTDFRHVWQDAVTGALIPHDGYALDVLDTGEILEAPLKTLWGCARQMLREARFHRHNATMRLVNPQGAILAVFLVRNGRMMWRAKGRG